MQTCAMCGAAAEIDYCPNCSTLEYKSVIEKSCLRSTTSNPIHLADVIMRHPAFPVAGQAHHPLVAACLLAAIRNAGGDVSESQIQQGIKRADSIPAGFCAGFGADAAAISCGISVAVMEKTTVKAEHAAGRTLAHLLTGQAMLAIAANSGNRCCKRSVFTVLDIAVTFFSGTRKFALEQPSERIQCQFFAGNPLCNGKACKFYPDAAGAIRDAVPASHKHLPLAQGD